MKDQSISKIGSTRDARRLCADILGQSLILKNNLSAICPQKRFGGGANIRDQVYSGWVVPRDLSQDTPIIRDIPTCICTCMSDTHFKQTLCDPIIS